MLFPSDVLPLEDEPLPRKVEKKEVERPWAGGLGGVEDVEGSMSEEEKSLLGVFGESCSALRSCWSWPGEMKGRLRESQIGEVLFGMSRAGCSCWPLIVVGSTLARQRLTARNRKSA